MDTGCAISPYIATKQSSTYDTVVTSIKDSIKALDKKKAFRDNKAEKRHAALRSLLYYSPTTELSQMMIPFIPNSDKITPRLAYFHLNWSQENIKDADSILPLIQNELSSKSLSQRIYCLRTFSHLVPNDSKLAIELLKYAESILEPLQASGKKDTKKLSKDSGLTPITRQILQFACLLAYRQFNLDFIPNVIFPYILSIISTNEFPVSVRHATALLENFAKNPNLTPKVIEELIKFTPNAPSSQIIIPKVMDDIMSRVYLVRTFSLFTDPTHVPNECKDSCNHFYETLGHFIWDISPRVAFEAIHKLAELGWARLKFTNIKSKDNIGYLHNLKELNILQRIINRLAHEVKNNLKSSRNAQCILSATFRAIIAIGHTFVSGEEQESSENPFGVLIDPMRDLLKDCQDFIRLKCLTAFIWIIHNNSQVVSSIFMKEMQLDTLTTDMYYSILRSLHERVIVSPHISKIALNFIYILATRRCEKAPFKPIAQLWTTIIKVAPEGKSKVQKHIFSILDYKYNENTHSYMNEIHRLAYYVLSREALNLTRRSRKTPNLSMTFVRSIILRLEHAAVTSSWEIRNVCIDGLTKVAFITPDIQLREQILQFFISHSTNDWNPFVLQIIALLQDIVESQKKWNDKLKDNDSSNLSEEDTILLEAENKQFHSKVSCYCTLPSSKVIIHV